MGVFPPPQCKFLIILVEFYLEKPSRNSQELTVCPLENGHLPGFFERKIPPQMSYVILGGPFSCQFVVFSTKSLNIKQVLKNLASLNSNILKLVLILSGTVLAFHKYKQCDLKIGSCNIYYKD